MTKLCVGFFVAVMLSALPMDPAQANRANGKAGQRALCKEKIEPKHLSGDPAKAEWKKCMEDANAYQ
jgi:hypothetical protein